MNAVADCLAGRISPEVALARLVLSGLSPAQIAPLLPAASTLAAVFAARRGDLATLARMAASAQVDHEGGQTPQAVGRMFDRAVAAAPEASVAAYSLNDPALLARATAELVDWLRSRGLTGPGAAVLDLGCGTGRVAASLASEAVSVLGLDVSPGMVAEAQRRHGHLRRVRFAVTDGQAPVLPPASLDLVLAVDSFPYLVQAGVADAHAAAAAHALRQGGVLVILNLSYTGDAADTRHVHRWAADFGFAVETCGERPFTLWDGSAFVLRRLETVLGQAGTVSR